MARDVHVLVSRAGRVRRRPREDAMPALIEYRCPRCRSEYPRDRFGTTPSGGRATLCVGCAATSRKRPWTDDAGAAGDADTGMARMRQGEASPGFGPPQPPDHPAWA
jgi:hypothetical protein